MPNTVRIIEEEYARRKERRDILQTEADVDEITRRMKAVEDGHSKMLTRSEADALFEELRRNG